MICTYNAGDTVFFEGDYIFFNGQTGKWSRGADKELIGSTTPFLCNMREICVGWLKFVDGKTDRQVGRIIDGYVRPPREALDDQEEQRWPFNRRGEREDPWKKVTYLPMRCMEDGAPVVYGPFSDTARRAIKSFVAVYRRRSEHDGKMPVVLLESRSFPNTSGGTTYVPTFKDAGWEYWDAAPAPEVRPVPLPPPAPAKPATAKLAAPVDARRSDMDDDIPF